MAPTRNAVLLSGGSHKGHNGGASLDILPVRVSSGGVEVLAYALLDRGSSMSFSEQVLIDELGLKGQGSTVKTFEPCLFSPSSSIKKILTTKCPEPLKSASFSLDVKPLDSDGEFRICNVVLIDQIPFDPDNRNVISNCSDLKHLRDVTLPEVKSALVPLLIGNDNYLVQFPSKLEFLKISHRQVLLRSRLRLVEA